MQPINRRPKGLQSLLDSKNLGVNPSTLASTVQPLVSLDDFFYADIPLQQDVVGGITTSGSVLSAYANIRVPLGETWAIRGWGATLTVGAPTTQPCSIAPVFLIRPGTPATLVKDPTNDPINTQALDGFGFGFFFERPFIASGGNELALVNVKIQGLVGNAVYSHSVAYYKLDT